MSTLFDSVELAPRDPILGLNEQYNADTRPGKVNLGVGVYYDDQGRIPLLGAVRKAEIDPNEIAAIGITNQRETTLLWERDTGACLHNAIVWQCRRTAPIIEQLMADGYGDLIRQKTGLVPDAYFSGTRPVFSRIISPYPASTSFST